MPRSPVVHCSGPTGLSPLQIIHYSGIMSTTVDFPGLGPLLADARAAIGISLQDVAEQAGCSTAYVHKLEQGRVRTPSPRVLGGLARALSLDYGLLMGAAGYDAPSPGPALSPPVAARFSNAHIVQLLEALQADVTQLRKDLDRLAAGK